MGHLSLRYKFDDGLIIQKNLVNGGVVVFFAEHFMVISLPYKTFLDAEKR